MNAAEATPRFVDSATPPTRFNVSHAWILLILSLALVGVTWIVYFGPVLPYAVLAPELDEVINTAAVVIAGSVAVRAWIRFHEAGEIDSLLLASAFLVLFMDGLLRVALFLTASELYGSFTISDPGQAPIYGWTLRRVLAALLLLAAVITAGQRPHVGRLTRLGILLGPAAVAVLFSVIVLNNESVLPVVVSPESLRTLLQPGQNFQLEWISAGLVATQILPGILFAAAAIMVVRSSSASTRRNYHLLLSAALLVAAISQVHYALVPGVYGDLVPSGDVLRLLFYVLALAAISVAAADDLIQLRRANEELRVLRAAEAEHATALERARIAREIHDGMAQELWLARLTTGSLANADLPPAAHETVERLDTILERALGEARQAIVTLQPSTDERFGELLSRYVDDYGDHFGMEIDCSLDTERSPDPAQQAELLRICRESLSNARKHADATRVRVSLKDEGSDLLLSIADNGRGFDPDHVMVGFGLESMRQRAQIVGAELNIDSAEMAGTRVTVRVPISERPSA
jgi:signal transduction histidine kinase